MKVIRGDQEGENPYITEARKAIDTAHKVIAKPVHIGSSEETIYTIKTKEGEMKVPREVFEYIKRNDIEQITSRILTEILLKVEREKQKSVKQKGADFNKLKKEKAYQTIIGLVIDQGREDHFKTSGKFLLTAWAKENYKEIKERYNLQFPKHEFPRVNKGDLEPPLGESTLYKYQQRFKKECQEGA